MDQAQQALAIARDVDDPALVARALTAYGFIAGQSNAEMAWPYLAEAIGLARATGDRWRLSQILARQASWALVSGDPIAARAAAEEGRDLADAIGDRFDSHGCRAVLGWAQIMRGDLAGAVAQFSALGAEAEAAYDVMHKTRSLQGLSFALLYQGEASAARAAADAGLEAAAELGEVFVGSGYAALAVAAVAVGDVAAAQDASEVACQHLSVAQPQMAAAQRAFTAQAALVAGDLDAARQWADDAASLATGWHLAVALTTRARVAIADGEIEKSERDAHDALTLGAEIKAYLLIPDILECLADQAREAVSHREAARLFGAAEGIRQRMGAVRFKIYDAGYEASVAALRDALGEKDFDTAWAEGAALSTEDAIAYAQRGRGERKRPTSGWASLTPTEHDVVRLVSEGLANKDIATRLFTSPRTVQTHLTHVYAKLGLTGRVQLVQEAARHT
jgi:DNA-binding CsgD family transcriptional regulator